jgi:hypothetical protein
LDDSRGENESAFEHRVPLSRQAMEILRDLERDREDGEKYVFAGQRAQSPAIKFGVADDATPHEAGRHHRPWFPLDIQRLGERGQFVQWGTPRDGACAHDPEQGRARLPSRRRAGKAAGIDGDLGRLVRLTDQATTAALKRNYI